MKLTQELDLFKVLMLCIFYFSAIRWFQRWEWRMLDLLWHRERRGNYSTLWLQRWNEGCASWLLEDMAFRGVFHAVYSCYNCFCKIMVILLQNNNFATTKSCFDVFLSLLFTTFGYRDLEMWDLCVNRYLTR